MSFIIGFLTFLLVLNCVFLALLILVQLPKKEAGLGVAFGGGAADALFGAGSGNVLTKITKYAAGTFFALAIVLTILNAKVGGRETEELRKALEQEAAQGQQNVPSLSAPTNITTPKATQESESAPSPSPQQSQQPPSSTTPESSQTAPGGESAPDTPETKSTDASGPSGQ